MARSSVTNAAFSSSASPAAGAHFRVGALANAFATQTQDDATAECTWSLARAANARVYAVAVADAAVGIYDTVAYAAGTLAKAVTSANVTWVKTVAGHAADFREGMAGTEVTAFASSEALRLPGRLAEYEAQLSAVDRVSIWSNPAGWIIVHAEAAWDVVHDAVFEGDARAWAKIGSFVLSVAADAAITVGVTVASGNPVLGLVAGGAAAGATYELSFSLFTGEQTSFEQVVTSALVGAGTNLLFAGLAGVVRPVLGKVAQSVRRLASANEEVLVSAANRTMQVVAREADEVAAQTALTELQGTVQGAQFLTQHSPLVTLQYLGATPRVGNRPRSPQLSVSLLAAPIRVIRGFGPLSGDETSPFGPVSCRCTRHREVHH